jgi:hypothetical protein
VALALWLGSGAEPGASTPAATPAGRSEAPPIATEVGATGRAPAAPAATDGVAAPDAAVEPAAAPAAPAAETVRVLAVLEDGTPLPGVLLEWCPWGVRLANQPLGAEEVRTDLAGGAEFPGPWADGVLDFSHPSAALVSVEGGSLANREGEAGVEVRVESNRVRLVFRDRPDLAHIRLVNAESGAPVADTTGLRILWEFDGGALVVKQETDPRLGGWSPRAEKRTRFASTRPRSCSR